MVREQAQQLSLGDRPGDSPHRKTSVVALDERC
jgi:hypothetical protein